MAESTATWQQAAWHDWTIGEKILADDLDTTTTSQLMTGTRNPGHQNSGEESESISLSLGLDQRED